MVGGLSDSIRRYFQYLVADVTLIHRRQHIKAPDSGFPTIDLLVDDFEKKTITLTTWIPVHY
jgi:hypothetical protein